MEKNEGKDLAKDMKMDEELLEKIKEIESRLKEEKQNENISVKFYENAELKLGKNILKVSIAEITEKFLNEKNETEVKTTYDVYMKYDGKDILIANINEAGNLHLNKEELERIDPENKLGLLELGKQEKPDLSTLKEIDGKTREELEKERDDKEKDEEIKDEDENEKVDEKEVEDEETKDVAEKKGIPEKDIFIIRKDSQFFKNHPEVDKSTYFYRDADGKMKAEYIDKHGKTQPSPYFEESTTALMSEPVISIGENGENIERKIPYQTMQTNNLRRPQGVRDIRISVYFENAYINIEETRFNNEGEWVGYGIEKQGRDYNSHKVNKMSDITKTQDKSEKISKGYEKVENTGFEEQGIHIDELSIKRNIDRFVEEGYNKKQAIKIVNYMIGEEKLSEENAKEKVNEEIIEEIEKQEKERLDDNQKTPWGDAEARRRR